MKGILGKKLGMSKVYTEDGTVIPVTVIKAGPCKIVGIRTQEKNGYTAVQLGFEEITEAKRLRKILTKPVLGQFEKIKDYKVKPSRYIREVREESVEGLEVGQDVLVDIFKEGEKVDISGKSIGKGFMGAVKRWHFGGAKDSHGASKVHRKPASAGATDGARTFRGKRGPGHMGNDNRTNQALKVVRVDREKNLLLVRGSVPGAPGNLVMVKKTVKVPAKRKHKVRGNR